MLALSKAEETALLVDRGYRCRDTIRRDNHDGDERERNEHGTMMGRRHNLWRWLVANTAQIVGSDI